MKRYSVTLINRNGYTIQREATCIDAAKRSVSFAPLNSFDGWIYDRAADAITHRTSGNGWKKESAALTHHSQDGTQNHNEPGRHEIL